MFNVTTEHDEPLAETTFGLVGSILEQMSTGALDLTLESCKEQRENCSYDTEELIPDFLDSAVEPTNEDELFVPSPSQTPLEANDAVLDNPMNEDLNQAATFQMLADYAENSARPEVLASGNCSSDDMPDMEELLQQPILESIGLGSNITKCSKLSGIMPVLAGIAPRAGMLRGMIL